MYQFEEILVFHKASSDELSFLELWIQLSQLFNVYCPAHAGLLNPADFAVYLLPYETQYLKSETFLQWSSLVLLLPAIIDLSISKHCMTHYPEIWNSLFWCIPFQLMWGHQVITCMNMAFVRQSSMGFPVLNFQMVENSTDLKMQNMQRVSEVLNSKTLPMI